MNGTAAPYLRMATPDDAAAVAGVYAPYVTDGVASFEADPPSPAQMRGRLESTLATLPWLVAEDGDAGELLGYAYAGHHRERAAYRWDVDVSVYLHARAHRRGVGTALYRALFGLLRQQGFVNAYAGIALPNPASVGLHEALGFTPVGVYSGVGHKFGRWIDVGWWELALGPRPAEPAEPRPWTDLDVATLDRALRPAT